MVSTALPHMPTKAPLSLHRLQDLFHGDTLTSKGSKEEEALSDQPLEKGIGSITSNSEVDSL